MICPVISWTKKVVSKVERVYLDGNGGQEGECKEEIVEEVFGGDNNEVILVIYHGWKHTKQ